MTAIESNNWNWTKAVQIQKLINIYKTKDHNLIYIGIFLSYYISFYLTKFVNAILCKNDFDYIFFMVLIWIVYNINNIGQKNNLMRVIGSLQYILFGVLVYFQFIHNLVPEISKLFPFGSVLITIKIEKCKKYIMYYENNINIDYYTLPNKQEAAHITSQFIIHDLKQYDLLLSIVIILYYKYSYYIYYVFHIFLGDFQFFSLSRASKNINYFHSDWYKNTLKIEKFGLLSCIISILIILLHLASNKNQSMLRYYSTLKYQIRYVVILYFGALLYLILVLISLFLFQSALHMFILILQHKILNESRDVRQLVSILLCNRVVYLVWLICHYLRCSIAFDTFIFAVEFSTKVGMLDISVLLWFDRREASFAAD